MAEQPRPTRGGNSLDTALSFVGFLIMCVAIAYGLLELRSVGEEGRQLEQELADLRPEIEALKAEIGRIRNSPLADLLTPRAIGVLREGELDGQGRQLFSFIVWLDLPYGRKSEIREVRYTFGDPSFLRNQHLSKEPSNGFAAGYLGWGLMGLVPIKVVTIEGEEISIDFSMRDEVEIVGRGGV